MSNVYRPFKVGDKFGIIDQYGAILYDSHAGFDTPTEADFVADFHNQHPDAEWERDVMPAFNARFNPPASEPAVDADTELLQWLQSQPKGKLMSMSLEYLAQLALEGDKASEPVDAGEAASEVTGSTPDDELIEKILWMLGVDAADWSSSLSGIYAAIRSNMQIGEPQMSKIEDWTDMDEINQDSLTGTIFKLLERAQEAERQLAAAGERERGLVAQIEPLEELHIAVFSMFITGATDDLTDEMANESILKLLEVFHKVEQKRAKLAVSTPPPAPDASALVEACKPFVALWERWKTYAMSDEGDYHLTEWLHFEHSNEELAKMLLELAAAAAIAAQGGEGA